MSISQKLERILEMEQLPDMSADTLWNAAWNGDFQLIGKCLDSGVPVDGRNANGSTPLEAAAYNGQAEACEILLTKGADPSGVFEATGESVLHQAITKSGEPGRTRIVKALIAAGAEVNGVTRAGVSTQCFARDIRTRGETPLHRAAAYGDVEMIEALTAAGADKSAKDAHGETPLTWASWHLRDNAILLPLLYGEFEGSIPEAAMKPVIRIFRSGEHEAIAGIFTSAIHEIASEDYTPAQCLAWSERKPNPGHWQKRCELKRPFVAEVGGEVAGFLELDPDGHIDCAYIHPKFKRRGIMTLLVEHAVETCFAAKVGRVWADASICAKPLFEKCGFVVEAEQEVSIGEERLTNYRMARMDGRDRPPGGPQE